MFRSIEHFDPNNLLVRPEINGYIFGYANRSYLCRPFFEGNISGVYLRIIFYLQGLPLEFNVLQAKTLIFLIVPTRQERKVRNRFFRVFHKLKFSTVRG